MLKTRLFDLSEKVAIVNERNEGTGFVISRGLAAFNAKVVLNTNNQKNGKKAVEAIEKEGGYAICISADVSKKESIHNMVERTVKQFGRIDILVNNMDFIIRKPTEEISEREWDNTIEVNLKSVFFSVQEVGTQMIKQKRGKIINVSSIGADCGLDLRSSYCASKGGVSQLTKALALDWAKYNINVNAIAPGVIVTNMERACFLNDSPKYEQLIGRICLGRLGEPEDIVGMAIFLASDASDYITGQTIYVDGGYTIF